MWLKAIYLKYGISYINRLSLIPLSIYQVGGLLTEEFQWLKNMQTKWSIAWNGAEDVVGWNVPFTFQQ